MNLSIQRKACEKFKQSLMEEGGKNVYAKYLCAKLDAYNRQISQTQKREEVWKGKERNYCGSVRVIFGNYAD